MGLKVKAKVTEQIGFRDVNINVNFSTKVPLDIKDQKNLENQVAKAIVLLMENKSLKPFEVGSA